MNLLSVFIELVAFPIWAFQHGKKYLEKRKKIDLIFGLILFAVFSISCMKWLQWAVGYLFLKSIQ